MATMADDLSKPLLPQSNGGTNGSPHSDTDSDDLVISSNNVLLTPTDSDDGELPLPHTSSAITPYSSAGILSRLFFCWLNPLLRLGNSRPLQLQDIPHLAPEDTSSTLYEAFSAAWKQQLRRSSVEALSSSNTNSISSESERRIHREDNNVSSLAENRNSPPPPSVAKALIACFWKLGLQTGLFALLRAFACTSGPLVLLLFVSYTERGNPVFPGEGFVLIAGLFLAKLVESFSQRHCLFGCRRLGLQMRSAVIAAVFDKELSLSSIGRKTQSSGEIVNYVAVDAYRIGEFPWYMHYLWAAPVQIALGVAILFVAVGLATLPGLVIILITAVLNAPLAKSLQKCQAELMVAQDKRLRATTEILNNIKVLKLQAWEDKFKLYLEQLRDEEFIWLSKTQSRRGAYSILYWMSPILVGSVVYATCVWINQPLTATKVFTVLSTLRIIQEPVRMIPEALAAYIQVSVSINRIGNFLREHDLPADAVERKHPAEMGEYVIKANNCTFTWTPESPKPTLANINIAFKRGEKVAVCGAVGSGKSSLLHALLGEIPKLTGSVEVVGSTAYVAQSAWIQSGTVLDNVLFGKPFNKERYERAIKACSLDKDIKGFAFGDQTEIGERGLNMSGGQKQRIQLARAVYMNADIYLLDDPFSAVDAHTAANLFKGCVMGALADKTVVLVTHQVEFLPAVDCILVMQGGQIHQSGRYDDLLHAGETFEQLVNAHQEALTSVSFGEVTNGEDIHSFSEHVKRELSRKSSSWLETQEGAMQLVQDEEMKTGDMGIKPYKAYITVSKGVPTFAFLTTWQSLFVFFQVMASIWIAAKVDDSATSQVILVAVYAILSLISGVFVHLRSTFIVRLGLKASSKFFKGMIHAVFRAPMSFFDSTPTGRILSRMSTDLTIVDLDIPFCFGFVVAGGLELISIIIVIAAVTWEILIIAIPMLYTVQKIQYYYVKSARELMRINATTKAPIVNFSGEAAQGAATIRAFQMVEKFKKKNLCLIDNDSSLYFHNNAALEWLIQRLELLANIVLCVTGLLLLVLPTPSSGFAGLALTYALALSGTQVFTSQWQCKLVNYIVSVERLNQYMHLPSEAAAVIEKNRPPANWPSEGTVVLDDLKIRYNPHSPLVVRGITCTFEGGKRVGIVGRTGSGKTTLIGALFRLVEPSGGSIVIDRIDICTIGLHDLRGRLGIIPQEPTLFRGTVRTNLDPLNQYSDDDIWQALYRCQLGNDIRESQLQLDSPVSDEGENWSAGQRQLFCLGRVLLKQSKVLVLDEATASVDSQTDALLQKVIREEFIDCTVITVAHRIPTVIDSDMVLALKDGKLIEYDTPTRLLENQNSLFAKLVVEYWSHVNHSSNNNLKPHLANGK